MNLPIYMEVELEGHSLNTQEWAKKKSGGGMGNETENNKIKQKGLQTIWWH